jgi:hypothetical protein
MARSPQGRKNQRERYQAARQRLEDKLARHSQRRARRAKAKRKPAERVVICVSEPGAAIGKDKSKVVRPLYNVQLVRDLDSPFLLGYAVFAAVTDVGLLPEMLTRTRRLAGTLPKEMLADSAYASVADLLACEKEQVTLYAPVKAAATAPVKAAATAAVTGGAESKRQSLPMAEAKRAEGVKRYYGKERFVWDDQTHSYTCPAGQQLNRADRGRESRVNGAGVEVERYATKACANCERRGECTPSKYGRRIKRMADEPRVEALRQRMASEPGKELYKKRKETIEREFADATEHRGMRRFSGYGPRQAETQVGLLFLLTNGKSLTRLRQAATRAA